MSAIQHFTRWRKAFCRQRRRQHTLEYRGGSNSIMIPLNHTHIFQANCLANRQRQRGSARTVTSLHFNKIKWTSNCENCKHPRRQRMTARMHASAAVPLTLHHTHSNNRIDRSMLNGRLCPCLSFVVWFIVYPPFFFQIFFRFFLVWWTACQRYTCRLRGTLRCAGA